MPTTILHLTDLCRHTIVAHFERYPPEVFQSLDLDEWETLLQVRHWTTAPKQGSGGLDGSGRLVPALGDKYLKSVEALCPLLAESRVADQKLWKDCVEHRFRKNGLTRPVALELPWPALVEHVQFTVDGLVLAVQDMDALGDTALYGAIAAIDRLPMNVHLLQETGAGKAIQKVRKRLSKQESPHCDSLDRILTRWKSMAAASGVIMSTTATHPEDASSEPSSTIDEDLAIAETCQTWRQLFSALQQREETRRSSQGKRMREMRQHLNNDRPKIVKVRPAKLSVRRERILKTPTAAPASGASGKLAQVRREAAIVASRQRPTGNNTSPKASAASALEPPQRSSFGAAVAVCNSKKRKGTSMLTAGVPIGNGKRMVIPKKVVQGSGAPRQFSSKYKTTTMMNRK